MLPAAAPQKPSQKSRYSKPYWDKAAQQFAQLIGYWLNAEKVRVRRRFYFGFHKASAIRLSVEKQKKWERVVAEHKAKEEAGRVINPTLVRTLPVWSEDERTSVSGNANDTADTTPNVRGQNQFSNVTISQAKDLFLKAYLKRVGLAGGVGIKPTTYNGVKKMLTISLGISTAKFKAVRERSPIDLNLSINALSNSHLTDFRNYWMELPDGIGVRTAINYCNHFKQLIDWCDQNEEFGFTRPKATDKIFNFRGFKKPHVEKYDPEKLKKLLAGANLNSDKTLLYCLLSIQCGHYQADIGELLLTDLRVINGEPFLWRKRTKRTGVNEEVDGDDDAEEHTLQYLWPETYALLVKHMAPKGNPHNRLLLNEHGDTLYEEQVDREKRDAISSAFERACETAGVKMQLRQLRKITWNAMKRIGKSDEFARKWAGQQVQGISRWYALDEFDDVTAASKKWREELVAANVLPKLTDMEGK